MVTNWILRIQEKWEAAKRRVLQHRRIAAVVFVVWVYFGARGFFYGDAPWTVIKLWLDWAGPLMTTETLGILGEVVIASIAAWVLLTGHYDQRAKVAEQEVRVMERDRDCNVLSKRLEESRLRQQVLELELDGSRAKVIELQQQQDLAPLQIQQLRAELHETQREHAHAEMQKLALVAETSNWGAITIVIRFIEYSDRKLADELATYIRHYSTQWIVEVRHEPGSTIRPVHDNSRVEIAPAANTHMSGIFTFAIARSRAVSGRVYHVNGAPDGPRAVLTNHRIP